MPTACRSTSTCTEQGSLAPPWCSSPAAAPTPASTSSPRDCSRGDCTIDEALEVADLAVAHNFVQPGKLVSMRLRSRWIRRRRTRPYPLAELVHGFANLSDDPAVVDHLERSDDPGAARELSARSVASLFGFTAKAPATAPPSLVLNGERDAAIPARATRLFTRWSGLPSTEVVILPRAGHLLFHDHLDATLPIVTTWVDDRLSSAS